MNLRLNLMDGKNLRIIFLNKSDIKNLENQLKMQLKHDVRKKDFPR